MIFTLSYSRITIPYDLLSGFTGLVNISKEVNFMIYKLNVLDKITVKPAEAPSWMPLKY